MTDTLDPAREQRLNELGFVWDARDDSREEMFGKLVAYKQQHGDCRVPVNHTDKQLGRWVVTQRWAKKSDNSKPHVSSASAS